MQGLELESHVSFSFAQWASPPYQDWGWVPGLWNRNPKGQIWAYSVSFKYILPTAGSGAFSPEKSSAGATGSKADIPCRRLGHMLGWSQDTNQTSRPRLICCLRGCQPWPPASCSHAVSGPSRLHPAQETALLNLGTSGSCTRAGGAGAGSWAGLGQALRQLWETGLSPGRL